MLRQYFPQRCRYERVGGYDRPVGTVPVGTIFRIPDDLHGAGRRHIVEAWLPREIGAGRRINGKYHDTFVARGGHLAIVRDLATGVRYKLSDAWIVPAFDARQSGPGA